MNDICWSTTRYTVQHYMCAFLWVYSHEVGVAVLLLQPGRPQWEKCSTTVLVAMCWHGRLHSTSVSLAQRGIVICQHWEEGLLMQK